MIIFSASVVDPAGMVFFKEKPNLSTVKYSRRGEVTDTLDGGAYVTDLGYSDAGRKLTFTVPMANPDDLAIMQYLVQSYSEVVLANKDGVFLGVPELITGNRDSIINFTITEKLSE